MKLTDHAIVKGITGPWPLVLGVNEVKPKAGAEVIATLPADQGGHPLLVAGTFGKGRAVAWTSDIGPHWLSAEFCAWEGYRHLWLQMLTWMTQSS